MLTGEQVRGRYQQHSELKDSAYALGKTVYLFESNKNMLHT